MGFPTEGNPPGELSTVPCATAAGEPSPAPGPHASRRAPTASQGAYALETPFIGRRAEIADLARLAERARLVSVVGLAGSGKTRLVSELLRQSPTPGRHQVVSLGLEGCSGPGQLTRALLASACATYDPIDSTGCFVGTGPVPLRANMASPRTDSRELSGGPGSRTAVRPGAGTEGTAMARELLRVFQLSEALVVLDSCDALGPEALQLLGRLIDTSRHLCLLATSQWPLRLAGEHVLRLHPLAVPEQEHLSPDELLRYEGPQLLLAAAGAPARPPFRVEDDATAATVARLCRHVGGLPLGLEVVGRMVATEGLEPLAGRLGQGSHSLRCGHGYEPQRARLVASLDRCLGRLGPLQRQLVDQLAVLPAGADIDRLAKGTARSDQDALVEAMVGAVASCLVDFEVDHGTGRYRLPPIVRHHVLGDLRRRGDLDGLMGRVLQASLEIVTGATEALVSGVHQEGLLDRMAAEHPNLCSCMEHALQHGLAEQAARLAEGLWRFWELRGRLSEGRAWLDRCLGATLALGDALLRAQLLDGLGMLAWRQGDLAVAVPAFTEALALVKSEQHGGLAMTGRLHNHLGLAKLFAGDVQGSMSAFEMSLVELEAARCPGEAAAVRANLALAAIEEGRLADALALLETALVVQAAVGDLHGQAICLLHRAIARYYVGSWSGAARDAREAAGTFDHLGDQRNLAFSILVLAACLADQDPGLSLELAGLGKAVCARLETHLPGAWAGRLEQAMRPAEAALGPRAGHLERQGAGLAASVALEIADASLVRTAAASPGSSPLARARHTWAGVQVLGRYRVTRYAETVKLPPQVANLLKLVACHGGSAHVEEVIEALWPEVSPGLGRRRLRNVLAKLVSTGGPLLERRGDLIALAEGVDLDSATFETTAREALSLFADADYSAGSAAARAAEALYKGDLLPTDPYAPWSEWPRRRLGALRLRLLDAWAAAAQKTDPPAAEECLRLAIMADPADEARYLMLARLLQGAGRSGAALEVLRQAKSWAEHLGLAASAALLGAEAELAGEGRST